MLEIFSPYRRLRPEVGDYKKGARRIKCPVLLVNISTDSEFPPYWAEELAEILNESSPDQARVKILDSPWGHMGCVQEGREIGKYISEFLGSERLKGALSPELDQARIFDSQRLAITDVAIIF